MVYISLNYYIFLVIALIAYYVLPLKKRWVALLISNAVFYGLFFKTGWWIFLATILFSYVISLLLEKTEGRRKKIILWIGIIGCAAPWLLVKNGDYILTGLLGREPIGWIVPIGISFYTLQIIAYLTDVYRRKVVAQRNLAKYALFISFFPQILQGPIPRYEQLGGQLIEGHKFEEDKFTQGFSLILWGFFLKLVIADKAAVVVNAVFDNYPAYTGLYIWIASFLYSIQLYADFLACTTLAQGVAKLFGIDVINNFARPYFATSVKDFWRRWHISLSLWLRDYIYIPLGGNRKGKLRKHANLVLTFIVSGIWHGTGLRFVAWGLLHAFYQITGDVTQGLREKAYDRLGITGDSVWKKRIKQVGTFLLINWAWIIFRADSLKIGLKMILHMFTGFNPWILFGDNVFALGLGWKEMLVLVLGVALLIYVGVQQEKGECLWVRLMKLPLPIRWAVYMSAILFIMVCGTYGYGFNAQDFIYGGF